MTSERKLLFVYNADTGLFNTMADIGHKIFSPQTYQCDLCALTHGYFQERKEWKSFIETIDISVEFLHRDEFRVAYPDTSEPLPAVFVVVNDSLEVCLPEEAIGGCSDINELQVLIHQNCTG